MTTRDSNLSVARLFEEIAQSLEVAGEQGHRLRAYRRAARGVAATFEPLEQLAAEGRLREIHGVGASLAALIAEFLETGGMRTHQRLVEEHPPGLAPLLHARGFGPAGVQALHAALGVTDLDQVEQAGRAGRLAQALGPRRAEALLTELPALRNPVRALRLKSAWETAWLVIQLLNEPGSRPLRLEVAGAARRMVDTIVGGLDLVAVPRPGGGQALLGLLERLPSVVEVVNRSEAGARVRLYDAVEVRLHLAEPQSFGATLLWHTGSAAHLERLHQLARARGYAYMALTDHSRSLAITNGLSLERLEEARREVSRLNHALAPFAILLGTEMDILQDGTLDYPDETLATLDYVSASVHSRFKQPEAQMTERIIRAVTHPLVHTLNHPRGRLLGARAAYAVDLQRVIEVAAAAGCALEVSADPARMDLDGDWARRVRDAGGRCTVSSDAHSTLDFDNIWLGIGSARRGWLEPHHVLNALPLDELRSQLLPRLGRYKD